jgi:hypothetical protein
VAKQILEHLGLPTTGPPTAPARSAVPDEDPPWQDEFPRCCRHAAVRHRSVRMLYFRPAWRGSHAPPRAGSVPER